MKSLLFTLCCCFAFLSYGQKVYHVFPNEGLVKGSANGDGSRDNPWDLQTALTQNSERVNGGDIIWIHGGIYQGNFKSTLHSTRKGSLITVSAYKSDKVVINGNTPKKETFGLQILGGGVIYKNLEITYLGDYSRHKSDTHFSAGVGISHLKGEDCKFQNLVIHNIPGSAIGSWKATGGTVIENCILYNNGYVGQRGHGVGIYIQNQSDKKRIIKNNIIFNNYYKGIEVWSATSGSGLEFVKNVAIADNMIFNNGVPVNKHVDNLIIASNDAEGLNVAKQIEVTNNIFYHNVDFKDDKNFGHGPSLTLGYTARAMVEDINITGNLIIGKNNGLNVYYAKSLEFRDNTVYTGNIHFKSDILPHLESGHLNFDYNTYYTRRIDGLRILKHRDYKMADWQKEFGIDRHSNAYKLHRFNKGPFLKIQPVEDQLYNVAVLEPSDSFVEIDFKEFGLKPGMTYMIWDVENRKDLLLSGVMNANFKIRFPMNLEGFEMPRHNAVAKKSNHNFNVFRIQFKEPETKKNLISRIFGWLF